LFIYGVPAAAAEAVPAELGDAKVREQLQGLGFEAQVVSDMAVTTADVANAAAVYISESVDSTKISSEVASALRTAPIPVVVNELYFGDELRLIPADQSFRTGAISGQWKIVNTNHPLAAGRPLQTVEIWTGSPDFSYSEPPVKGTVIATDSTGTWPTFFGFEKGEMMELSTMAPERRVLIAFQAEAPSSFTADGWALFNAAINWTLKK
jgi:hypothetical protein